MYFKKIEIENVGPLKLVEVDFHKDGENPKPVILVGENGAGKSIFLSHLINSLIVGKQSVFDDVEVEKGKVYKYRSPHYIRAGENYSFSNVEFDAGIHVQEWQLRLPKAEFEQKLQYTSVRKGWQNVPSDEASYFASTFGNNITATKNIFQKQCVLYFPVNRFEEPAWLNQDNLISRASYTELKKITGYSNRNIVCTSPLKANRNWLLDLLFDRQAFDISLLPMPIQTPTKQEVTATVFAGYSGVATNLYNSIVEMVRIILQQDEGIALSVGARQDRQVSISRNNEPWISNIFQLSTGETQLLNLFLSIIRDYDYSDGALKSLADISGVVIIDEIDTHLHSVHQREILPRLIAAFPKVQFIITTHAPLFLLGMEEKFGADGCEIINLPEGERVGAADFSEFNTAYESFKETVRHRNEIEKEIKRRALPSVFVEGDYDIRYIEKAAELLGKEAVLQKINLLDGTGYGNLDKIWRSYQTPMSKVIPNKIILLYDCDTKKQNAQKHQIYKRVVPQVSENPIQDGVENLFSADTIAKIEKVHPQFIDTKAEFLERKRGVETIVPSTKLVNSDEKGNLCEWLCENGDVDDFACFEVIFNIIDEVVQET